MTCDWWVEFVRGNLDGGQIAEQNSDSVKGCAQSQRRLQERRISFKNLRPTLKLDVNGKTYPGNRGWDTLRAVLSFSA